MFPGFTVQKDYPVPLRAPSSHRSSWLLYLLGQQAQTWTTPSLAFYIQECPQQALSTVSSPCDHVAVTAGIPLKQPAGRNTGHSIQQAPRG